MSRPHYYCPVSRPALVWPRGARWRWFRSLRQPGCRFELRVRARSAVAGSGRDDEYTGAGAFDRQGPQGRGGDGRHRLRAGGLDGGRLPVGRRRWRPVR